MLRSPQRWRTGATLLAASGVLWAAGEALAPFGASPRAIGLLLLFPPALWITLRVGLPAGDRQALGKTGRKLGLIGV